MQPTTIDRADSNSLRFAFDDAVISLRVPTGATFEDVAWLWDELANEYHATPVNIKLTFATPTSVGGLA